MISFNKYLLVPALSICHFVYALETFVHALETWDALDLCALGSQHGPVAITWTFIVVQVMWCWRGVQKKSSKCFNLNQPALQLPQINFSFFAMALNDVPGLLLPVAWHDLTQVISLQTSGSCGPAVSVSGRWPGPRAHREHTCITTSCRVTVWAEYRWQAESILDWYHVDHDQITSITITWNLKSGLQWVGLGHGQCDPPPLRPLPPRQASHIVCYSNVVWSYR